MLNRRDVLGMGVSAAAALTAAQGKSADNATPTDIRIIDTNVSLFRWPFRRLPLDDTDRLFEKLRGLGISEAWAGSFEGLLHRDISGVNRRLIEACQGHAILRPVGSINLNLPAWEDDLRECFDVHDMPGVRLYPNYHGYTLNDKRFASLLETASAADRFVQIAAAMEDTRTQHHLTQVPDVDLSPLAERLSAMDGTRVQILNYRPRLPLDQKLADTPGLYFDTARVDATDGVPGLVESTPDGRVLFGSHAPFLIPEAALIRVHESGTLDKAALRSVLAKNAATFSGREPR